MIFRILLQFTDRQKSDTISDILGAQGLWGPQGEGLMQTDATFTLLFFKGCKTDAISSWGTRFVWGP